MTIRILMVDDEPNALEIAKDSLERLDPHFNVETADSSEDALESVREKNYDAIISNLSMPSIDEIELLRDLRDTCPGTPLICFAKECGEETRIQAMNAGADFFLNREGDTETQFEQLQDMIERALNHMAAGTGRESVEIHQTIFNRIGIAAAVIDDAVISLVNREFEELTGYSREELEGRVWTELLVDDQYDSVSRTIEGDGGEKAPERARIGRLGKEGEITECHLAIETLPGVTKNVISLLDMSRLRPNVSREVSSDEWKLLDNIKSQVWYATDPETYGKVNKARADFLGMEREDLVGKKLREVMDPSEAEVCIAGNRKAFQSKRKYQKEEWVTDNEGELRCMVVTKSPKLDDEGNVECIVCTAHDITERKRTEQELRRTRKEMEQIIDFLPDATFVVDSEGKISAWNRAMERMTGHAKQEMLGRGFSAHGVQFYGETRPIIIDLIFSEDERAVEEIRSHYNYVEKEGDTYIAEAFAPELRDGEGAYIWIMASPLYNEEGETIGAIESVRDITDRREIHSNLELAHDKLNLISSVIRHDIFNKLSVIEGYNDLMLSNVSDEQLIRYLTKMGSNIEDI